MLLREYEWERRGVDALFQMAAIMQKRVLNLPFDHLALAKSPRVKINLCTECDQCRTRAGDSVLKRT